MVGPQNPPAGIGSLELETPLPTDKVYLFNYDHVNTPLSSISAIGYSTYRDPTSTASDVQVTSINIQIDKNGGSFLPGDFATLVFEPVYNSQGPVVEGAWQTWDAYQGGQAMWWSTRPKKGGTASGGPPFFTAGRKEGNGSPFHELDQLRGRRVSLVTNTIAPLKLLLVGCGAIAQSARLKTKTT